MLLYGLESQSLYKYQLNSLGFTINRFFMKLFRTTDSCIVSLVNFVFIFFFLFEGGCKRRGVYSLASSQHSVVRAVLYSCVRNKICMYVYAYFALPTAAFGIASGGASYRHGRARPYHFRSGPTSGPIPLRQEAKKSKTKISTETSSSAAQ